MKEGLNTEELKEAAREARRLLMREQEELMERAEQLKGFMTTLDSTDEVLQENERRKSENEAQQ